MSKHLLAAVPLVILVLLSFFQFPGHTILQSDTQIYIPILERLTDSSLFANDIVAARPHVAFTIYDEVAIVLKRLTGLSFEAVLMGQQFVYRLIAIVGLFMLVFRFGLSYWHTLLVVAVFSLGATITGPAVLIVEYEPVPRGFCLPFLFLALGLLTNGRWTVAAVSAGIGFLFHPPTGLAFLGVFFLYCLYRRRWTAAAILLGSAALMALLIRIQPGVTEQLTLFTTVDPALEQLQRMRASYNYVSIWIDRWWIHYLIAWFVAIWSARRLRDWMPVDLQWFCWGLPAIGIASVPLSYVLLEQMKWAFVPQIQPGRYLIYTVIFALLLGSIAAIRAAKEGRHVESILLFIFVFGPVTLENLTNVWTRAGNPAVQVRTGIVIGLALLMWFVCRVYDRRWAPAATVLAALMPFFVIPTFGRVVNYPRLHTPELDAVSKWAHDSTPKDAIFLFPDAGQKLEPGVFRARSQRALYVDWKGGGQLNFLPVFGKLWWARWQEVEKPQTLDFYRSLGINYIVVSQAKKIAGMEPVYSNAAYVVYKIA